MKRRIISLLLVLCMVLSVAPVSVFAAEGQGAEKTYVSVGASNVNGYGLRGYIPVDDATMDAAALDPSIKAGKNVLGYAAETPGSYPVLISDALGYDLEQLAISSMRAEELRILLDNDYYGDSYSAWRFVGPGKWFEIATRFTGGQGGMDELREAYQSKIAAADLVTVDIGMNNFGVYISYQMTSNYSLDNDMATIDPAMAEEYEAGKAYVEELIAAYVPEYSELLLSMDEFVDTLAYALVGFCVNFDMSMEKIYELNPDATVVVLSIQNLMDGLYVTVPGVDAVLPLGDLFGALINAANVYVAGGSPYADKYLVADVRQNGRVEFFLDDIVAYNGDPYSLSQNIIDCLDVYDGTPGASYDSGLHVKYMLNKSTYAIGGYTDEMLYAAYDAVASILQAAAQESVVDMGAIANMRAIEGVLLNAIVNEMVTAVTNAAMAGAFVDYELPENFFEEVAEASGAPVSQVVSVASLAVRTSLGNSFFGHPNPNGHAQTAGAVLAALENETTGEDVLVDEAVIALNQAYELVLEYYDEAYAYGYAYAAENGYIADAVAAIDGVIADLKAIDLSDAEMTDAFKAEAAGEIKEVIDILEAAKALLLEADVLDQATLDSLVAMLDEAGEAAENLLNVLDQAASDVVELAVIPAVEKALYKLETEVVPAIIKDLQDAVDAATAWLMEQVQAAYDAMVAAIVELAPKFDQWAYNWLYNNPDKVIAFFNEYGDEGVAFLAEYKEVVFTVLGYLAQEYGDDVVDYVLENPEEVLAAMCQWVDTYGERTWEMIKVYLKELGLLPDSEAVIAALDLLVDMVEDMAKEQVDALVKALTAALDEAKEAVINSPEAQALVKKLEAAINALEELAKDVEANADEMKAAAEELAAALVEAAQNAADKAVQDVVNAFMAAIEDATTADYVVDADSYYVAIGDTSAASESYVDQLAAELGVDYTNLAGDYSIEDAYAVVQTNVADVAKADLITLGFNNAEFVNKALNDVLSEEPVDYAWETYVGEAGAAAVEAALEELKAYVAEAGMAGEIPGFGSLEDMVISVVESYAYSVAAYAFNLPELINVIRTVNEDAVIIVVGMYNPMDEVVFDLGGGNVVDVTDYLNYLVDAAELHGLLTAMITGDAIFVEAADVETKLTDKELDLRDLINEFLVMNGANLNPSEAGHTYIKDQIMNALNVTVEGLLGDVNLDGKINVLDIDLLRDYLLERCELSELQLANADVTKDGDHNILDIDLIRDYLLERVESL